MSRLRSYSRPYVGTLPDGTRRTFRVVPDVVVMHADREGFSAFEGPFKTVAGALYFESAAPQTMTVAQAERRAKEAKALATRAISATVSEPHGRFALAA